MSSLEQSRDHQSEIQQSQTGEQTTAERLVAIAGEIFAEKGRGATVREICGAAGCSVAAVNYYFGDKNQLYLRCVQAACEHKQRLFPLPELEDSRMASPQLLREFLRTIVSRMGAKANLSWHNTLMLREVMNPSKGVAEMLQSPFGRDFRTLDQLVSGLLGPQLDSPELRKGLVTQILGRCMFFSHGQEP